MARLKGKHKSFIVRYLACYETPTEVADLVKEEFDIEVSRQQIKFYSPNDRQGGRELSQKWKDLFEMTRKEYLEDAIQHPIAHKGYRIAMLHKPIASADTNKNTEQVRKLLETAAKEIGGQFEANDMPALKRDRNKNKFFQQINRKIVKVYGTEEEKAELAQKELTEG